MRPSPFVTACLFASSAAATAGTQHGYALDSVEVPEPDHDDWHPRSLLEVYEQYDEAPLLDHWVEYAEHYELHLPKPDGVTPIKMMEIGVQSGGSARVWKQYYGEPLTYVGVDIEPKCKRSESIEENIFVEIGSQLDTAFLSSVCAKHGPFDVVIDDGGHSAWMMQTTLAFMWNHSDACLSENATYVIEDMHAMALCASGGYCDTASDITSVIGNAFHGMHAHWYADGVLQAPRQAPSPAPQAWASQIRSISLYDSMAFFKRGKPLKKLSRLLKGSDIIPYGNGDGDTRRVKVHGQRYISAKEARIIRDHEMVAAESRQI